MKRAKIYGKPIKIKPQSKLNEDSVAKSRSPLKNLHQIKTQPAGKNEELKKVFITGNNYSYLVNSEALEQVSCVQEYVLDLRIL